MKLFLSTLLLQLNLYLFAQQPVSYFQQQVNHNLSVIYNQTNNSLTANQIIDYTNNSSDTLYFIYFHVWLNAFKNDKTYYTRQAIENNNTEFYFSNQDDKGYINKLSFKIANQNCNIVTDSANIDIIKVLLPKPLPPTQTIKINNSFAAKLPKIFSRGGASGSLIALTQWYPKPAVYNNQGWHTMPYTDQGEFYNEFGNYELSIDIPENFVAAGAGLQNINNNLPNTNLNAIQLLINKKRSITDKQKIINSYIQPSIKRKELIFKQQNVTDIAIVIDKNFTLDSGTVTLPSGKTISLYCYYQPWQSSYKNAIEKMKRSILFYSNTLGDYPHATATIVDGGQYAQGGMEYPAITLLGLTSSNQDLDILIAHELGHNWFQGALANNERKYPYLDEGFNTFIEQKYQAANYNKKTKSWFNKRIPSNIDSLGLAFLEQRGLSQPINTSSYNFTQTNYGLNSYLKTAVWLRNLEQKIGQNIMAKALKEYFSTFKNKHVAPNNFNEIVQRLSPVNISSDIANLDASVFLTNLKNVSKKIKVSFLFNTNNTATTNNISIMPYLGFNVHNGLQLGTVIHNYQLPFSKFRFYIAPALGLNTKTLIGKAQLKYDFSKIYNNWYTSFQLNYQQYTSQNFKNNIFGNFNLGYKVAKPSISFFKMPKNKRSYQYQKFTITYNLINEDNLNIKFDSFFRPPIDTLVVPNASIFKVARNFATVSYKIFNERKLYPYEVLLNADITNTILRTSFTYKQFFNYNSDGAGINVRLFAGKIIYLQQRTIQNQINASNYVFALNAPTGNLDYNYNNTFLGRGAFPGFGGGANTPLSNIASQQIIERDGAFKFRTPLLGTNDGFSDNWMIALNFSTTIPNQINPLMKLPLKIPLRFFVDIGTYANKWQRASNAGNKIIANAGLELSVFKDILHIYMPVIYGAIYKEYTNSTVVKNKFIRNISFTLNFNNLKKLLPYQLATPIFK